MLKLFLRAVHNVLYALEDMIYECARCADVLLSALMLGAKGETISARLWRASQPDKPLYQRLIAKPLRWLVDGGALFLAGQVNHCQSAYSSFVAEQKPA